MINIISLLPQLITCAVILRHRKNILKTNDTLYTTQLFIQFSETYLAMPVCTAWLCNKFDSVFDSIYNLLIFCPLYTLTLFMIRRLPSIKTIPCSYSQVRCC